jgi:uncharacterized protein (TIGR04141 family)
VASSKNAPPIARLNIFLIKQSVTTYDACIKESERDSVDKINLKQSFGFAGKFILKKARPKPLSWLKFVKPVLDTNEDLIKIFSSYASALLFIKAKNRIFAFSFGGGKNLLEPGVYEPDFGLKVALNVINPQKLRSVDVHNLDDSAMQTRKQSGLNSGLEVFGLDIERDLLRSVTGVPVDQDFAVRITGRDSLLLQTKTSLRDLKALCETSLDYFKRTTYREHFDWLDSLRPVTDPHKEEELFGDLISSLTERETNGVHLSFPEILSGEEQYVFKYPTGMRANNPEFEDLSIEDFYGVIPDDFEFSIERLKSLRILAKPVDATEYTDKWRLVDCLTYQKRIRNRTYVLSQGLWYEVKNSLVGEAEAFVKSRYLSTHELVSFMPAEVEEAYNIRAAQSLNLTLFDRKTKALPGASTPIEVCDLFNRNGRFYHVKRKMRSATLSHLFSQGYVSGVSLIDSKDFRTHARDILGDAGLNKSLIPLNNFSARRFRICYAIMARKRGAIENQLPFFSQLTFRQNAKALERMGYKVHILRVDQV